MRITDRRAMGQFLSHGVLATLRTYPYERKLGGTIFIRSLGGKPRIKATVEKVIVNPSREDLEKHLSISGFRSVDEWLKTAEELHGRNPNRLVVIKVEKDERIQA